jgi:phosphopantetheinyl transferase
MLPTLDPRHASLAPGCAIAVFAHRADGIDRDRMREQWLEVVAAFAGVPCEALAVERTPAGKPKLVTPAGLWFNASYGARWSLLAVSAAGELGCDVEDRLMDTDYARLSALVLHEAEHARFAAMPPAEQPRAFARCWVRKEAILKAEGTGLGHDPRLLDTGPGQLVGRWRLHEADHPGVPSAVASLDADCRWFAYQEPS